MGRRVKESRRLFRLLRVGSKRAFPGRILWQGVQPISCLGRVLVRPAPCDVVKQFVTEATLGKSSYPGCGASRIIPSPVMDDFPDRFVPRSAGG